MRSMQVVATAVFLAAITTIGVSQQKSVKESPTIPVKESALIIEYFDVPTTLEDATARADAIVRARIVGSQFRTEAHPELSVPDVNTVYTLDIVEVLKQDPRLPVPTELFRPGGDVETTEGIQRVVEKDFPPFEPGAEHVLFLYWNENVGMYHVSKGPAGAFRITPQNRLYGFGPGKLAKEYLGQDPGEVVSRIRELVAVRLVK